MISPEERVDKIRALNYLLQVLGFRSIRARRAMKNAPTAAAFNEALGQSRAIDEQLEKYRNEWFDLTEA